MGIRRIFDWSELIVEVPSPDRPMFPVKGAKERKTGKKMRGFGGGKEKKGSTPVKKSDDLEKKERYHTRPD